MKLVLALAFPILVATAMAVPAAVDSPGPAAEFSEDGISPGRWFVTPDRPADAGTHNSLTVRAALRF